VGIESVECLDERYIKIKQLEKEIEIKERLNKLKEAAIIFHVKGPNGGDKGIYLKMENNSRSEFFVGKPDVAEVVKLCKENSLEVKEILESDLNKLY
jgi:hypothetical protein